jgi:hypothetical protein
MELRWTSEFLDDARRHGLVFTCEDCGNFDAARDACAHEWPTELHRRARYEEGRTATGIVFCKEFDAR